MRGVLEVDRPNSSGPGDPAANPADARQSHLTWCWRRAEPSGAGSPASWAETTWIGVAWRPGAVGSTVTMQAARPDRALARAPPVTSDPATAAARSASDRTMRNSERRTATAQLRGAPADKRAAAKATTRVQRGVNAATLQRNHTPLPPALPTSASSSRHESAAHRNQTRPHKTPGSSLRGATAMS